MVLAVRSGMTARLFLILPGLALASCGLFEQEHVDCIAVDCIPCASPLTLRLEVPVGQPPPEAILQGVAGSCSVDPQAGQTVCSIAENHAGTFEFDVQATGYQKAHVRQTVAAGSSEGCCPCPYVSQAVDVQLTPQ